MLTRHFRERVHQRVGPGIDPDELAAGIWWAIENNRNDLVSFVARLSRNGLRMFRFRVPDGRVFLAVLDTKAMQAVTVYPPGRVIRREGKRPVDTAAMMEMGR